MLRIGVYCILLLVLLVGCSTRYNVIEKRPVVQDPLFFATVYTLDGSRVATRSLLEDKTAISTEDGRLKIKVDGLEYLLFIVSHSECAWTKKFLSETRELAKEWQKAKVRIALILLEKGGYSVQEWKEFDVEGIAVMQDRDGAIYNFYVKTSTPSINIITRWGNKVFFCDGYVSPQIIVEKIRKGDFGSVKPEGG